MFSYARRLLTGRPALWWAAVACAAFLVAPAAVGATLLVRPVTIFLLSGDIGLAADFVPEFLTENGWLLPAISMFVCLLAVSFNRLYAVLLRASDEEREEGWTEAWASTKSSWRRVLLLSALFLGALVIVIAAIILLTAVALVASPGAATLVFLTGAAAILLVRTIGRIHVTLAMRAVVLDDRDVRSSWKQARSIVRDKRRQVVAAWASLLALGVAVWLGGRLVTPILQDTALDFPSLTSYAFAREGAQLAVAIPLEAFVLVFSSAIWTAVYRGIDTETEPANAKPWIPRALTVVVVLAIIGNGVPAVVDVAWQERERDRERALRASEIKPDDAVSTLSSTPTSGERTTYEVTAHIEGETLRWSTMIGYRNTLDRPLRRLPLRVYAAAFTGEVEDMPLADDVLSSAVPNTIRERVRAGTFDVDEVASSGKALDSELTGTVLWVDLDQQVRPGGTIDLRVNLSAELPSWPLRYGIWDRVTQLGNWIPTVPVAAEGDFLLDDYGDVGDPFVSQTADYDVRIEASREVGVVGTGDLVDVRDHDDTRTWRFLARNERDAAFAAGTALRGLERRAGGMLIRTWYNGEDTLLGSDLLDDATSALNFFTSSYGTLATTDIDIVTIENPLGGMEYPGLVFVSAGFSQLEGLPLIPDLVVHSGFVEEQQKYVAGHELAHLWWFASVGNDQVREPWLDEAFAEASTRLWLRSTDGHERTSKIAHLEDTPQPEIGVIDKGLDDFDTNSAYADEIYDAGSAILLELHEYLGTKTYNRLMQTWLAEFEGRIATVDDFVEVVERVAGNEARDLLEAYRG